MVPCGVYTGNSPLWMGWFLDVEIMHYHEVTSRECSGGYGFGFVWFGVYVGMELRSLAYGANSSILFHVFVINLLCFMAHKNGLGISICYENTGKGLGTETEL
ncbi:hypothetical protein B0T19DRAFT_161405 [Cercophora scortea]|uniref:Transmembrane protein n=1 Tax=Cercophora scortea TaxID=314031 RepID=A0AAE0ILS4_9PEZI|nr:hypothetical protein B0T19DRAFT_161405 [Cercophora scortea]